MKLVKKNKEVEIYTKRSGRYAVIDRKTNKFVNGDDKFKVLVSHKLTKVPAAKPKAAAPVEAEGVEKTSPEATA